MKIDYNFYLCSQIALTNYMKRLANMLSLLFAAMTIVAQTDVTSDYFQNPSFEADGAACTDAVRKSESSDGLRGWDVSSITGWQTTRPDKQLLITSDCYTDNNFGKTAISDGTYALFQRNGWSNKTSTVSQTTSAALSAGTYLLKFRSKAFYANSATSTFTAKVLKGSTALVSLGIAFEPGSAGCMSTSEWTEQTLRFTVDAATAVTVQLTVNWVSGGSQLALDDFRLISIPDDYVEPTIIGGTEDEVSSPTEGVITHAFVPEAEMMQDLLQMLANHLTYMKSLYTPCVSPNSVGEECGFFKDTEGQGNDEKVVRPNADFSMIAAFLWKYAQGKVTLPEGITWDNVREMAVKSLIWGYSSHKANKLKVTSRNAYWGSTSTSDYTWESSLWAMSLCYAAHFLDSELTATQKTYIYNMVRAECNYELGRSIPTGFSGDTKAEENGWEADILACALGLYPDDDLAAQWFERLRLFAINSYSQRDDATDNTVIDPEYNQTTVADLYRGQNLYDDYTLQNHNLFHTSYQNVVMQELGEAQLAMQLFQTATTPKWQTRALMHNQQKVMDEVLNRLALADGELAMPNGNDWSLFLFDQITSYSTMACFLRDKNALLLENMAYKFIKARQQTTTDGSWLLRSDVGSRRMGVEAHRVMMTYLMHAAASTADLQPATWEDFSEEYAAAHLFRSQNIVRASSKDRFVCFSWSDGLKSYTGYFTDTTPDRNKIVCPYRANNTGNLLGWYTVDGKNIDATPVVKGIYALDGNAFTMNGRLNTNGSTLENSFVIAATKGNAVVYMNSVKALADVTVTGRRGGLLAITTDPFTRPQRTLYNAAGRVQTDGTKTTVLSTPWANIDNSIGIVTLGGTGMMAFGEQANNNSILCSKFYPLYSVDNENFKTNASIDRSAVIYYSRVSSETTAALQEQAVSLAGQLPDGWNAIRFADADGTPYLLAANFGGKPTAQISGLTTAYGAPVLAEETTIIDGQSSATLTLDRDHSLLQALTLTISGADVVAKLISPLTDPTLCSIRALGNARQTATVTALADGKRVSGDFVIEPSGTYLITLDGGDLRAERQIQTTVGKWLDVTDDYLQNPGFELDQTWGTTGNITLNGVTYNPCYTQGVAAADANFPQVLPVQGWTPENGLSSATRFSLMYSMPYSDTQYCVSPSDVGNSANIMSVPAGYADAAGSRCLSILNSWAAGSNAISQDVTLPVGNYLATMLVKYVCPNENCRRGENVISTTVGNDNTSLCGIEIGSTSHYAYPTLQETWEELSFPFELTEATDVCFRLGLATSQSQGAANNTRLYIDNVRLFRKDQRIMGDLNGDGAVTIADLTALLTILLKQDDTQPYRFDHETADIVADGEISIEDAHALVNLLLTNH